MDKWKHKFEGCNRSLEDDGKKIALSYHYRLSPSMLGTSTKSFSKFSTVDPILLKGNAGEVGLGPICAFSLPTSSRTDDADPPKPRKSTSLFCCAIT